MSPEDYIITNLLTVKLSLVYCIMQLFFCVCYECMLFQLLPLLSYIILQYVFVWNSNSIISTQRVSHVVRKEMDGVRLSLAVSCFAWLQGCFLLAQGPLC